MRLPSFRILDLLDRRHLDLDRRSSFRDAIRRGEGTPFHHDRNGVHATFDGERPGWHLHLPFPLGPRATERPGRSDEDPVVLSYRAAHTATVPDPRITEYRRPSDEPRAIGGVAAGSVDQFLERSNLHEGHPEPLDTPQQQDGER